MRTLVVEGWRFICHSYAVVNQWQLLSMLRRNDIRVVVRDLKYPWRPVTGVFPPADEEILRHITIASDTEHAEATLRIAFPYNFSPAPAGRTAVFGTAEYGVVVPSSLRGTPNVASLASNDDFKIVTPSHWSAKGFRKLGFRAEQILVVPHGVNITMFTPIKKSRKVLRKHLGARPKDFIFGNFGALSGNKGIDLLLRAFAAVAEKQPAVTLLLKGMDTLYSTRGILQHCLAQLPARTRQLVGDRLFYIGDALSMRKMAELYQICDAYVAPYRAEAFNIPVLEAAACGLPIICSAGGPTDEFIADEFAFRVESRIEQIRCEGLEGFRLTPNLDHLIEGMFRVMDDEKWRTRAAISGPHHVSKKFTWDHVVSSLLDELF